jgi:phosphatidylserine/phosphatidylglycerophosphate/cardiolipin synthase-like enzyme/uncharacterized membrane protein YdjX (TVP38/TMEM64 family)
MAEEKSFKMAEPVLQEGKTCWRIAQAQRAAVLIDGATYYDALRAAMANAEHSIFIVGWDIDSRTPLVGSTGEAHDGGPRELGAFLTELVRERPALQIHLLLWDYSLIYALDREPLPAVSLDWMTPPEISVCLDDVLPLGASHHQKIVVIDDSLAFSGGLDLTIRRWDVPDHKVGDDRRCDPAGQQYRPFHDIQMMVDGEAAQALAELVRKRWRNAACEKPRPLSPAGDRWPAHVEPDFTNIEIGIARTFPAYDGDPEVREVEALFLEGIARAERTLYFENQFLTAHRVADALVRRLEENPALEVLIVAPNVHHSWLEERAMNTGRLYFMQRLEAAGVNDRVALLYPSLPSDDTGEGVMVHAKFTVVDDWLLRVGSANLNNRSMGMDSECDLALEAASDDQRRGIVAIRDRLLGEHLGVKPDKVAAAIADSASFLDAVRGLSDGARSLKRIHLDDVPDDELARYVEKLADPERPISPPRFIGDMFGGRHPEQPVSRVVKLSAMAFLLLCVIVLWRYTPLSTMTDPNSLLQSLEALVRAFWMPILIPVIYVLGTLVAFPITALIAFTGMIFAPPVAAAYAIVGSLLGASATYLIGRLLGRGPLRSLMGRRVNRISRALARQGVLSVAALRMAPIAPFTFINMAAGASHIRFADFIMGTFVGMAPGIVIIALLGSQLAEVLRAPSTMALGLLAIGLLVWLALSLALQYVASRLRSE